VPRRARGDVALAADLLPVRPRLAVATSVKAGAYTNYYLEPFAAGCVLTAGFIEDWRRRPAGRTETALRLGWLGVACAGALIAAGTAVAQWPAWVAEITHHRPMRARERQVFEDFVRELRALDGVLLVEDPYLAIRVSAAPYMVDPSLFAELQRQGKFDDGELVRQIEAGKFAAIVLIAPLDDRPTIILRALDQRHARSLCAGHKTLHARPARVDVVRVPATPMSQSRWHASQRRGDTTSSATQFIGRASLPASRGSAGASPSRNPFNEPCRRTSSTTNLI